MNYGVCLDYSNVLISGIVCWVDSTAVVSGEVALTLLKRIDSRWRPNSKWRLWFRQDEVGILSEWGKLLIEVSGRCFDCG